MRFEKVNQEIYAKYLEHNRDAIVSDGQIALAMGYFKELLPLPVRSTGGAAGYDFVAPITVLIPAHGSAKVPTGIKVKLDDDKFLAMYIRSGYATKHGLELMNQVSVIDSDYYDNPTTGGHIIEFVKNNSDEDVVIECGSRFCQGVIQQYFVVEGDKAGVGNPRKGGFGSTGNKEIDNGRRGVGVAHTDTALGAKGMSGESGVEDNVRDASGQNSKASNSVCGRSEDVSKTTGDVAGLEQDSGTAKKEMNDNGNIGHAESHHTALVDKGTAGKFGVEEALQGDRQSIGGEGTGSTSKGFDGDASKEAGQDPGLEQSSEPVGTEKTAYQQPLGAGESAHVEAQRPVNEKKTFKKKMRH